MAAGRPRRRESQHRMKGPATPRIPGDWPRQPPGETFPNPGQPGHPWRFDLNPRCIGRFPNTRVAAPSVPPSSAESPDCRQWQTSAPLGLRNSWSRDGAAKSGSGRTRTDPHPADPHQVARRAPVRLPTHTSRRRRASPGSRHFILFFACEARQGALGAESRLGIDLSRRSLMLPP